MPNTITKKTLVEAIADNTGQRRVDVKRTLQELLDQIVSELGEGNRIEFRDFGVFEVKQRAARSAQNPRTLERVKVPAKRTVKFKPGRKMKDILDGTSDQPEGANVIAKIDHTSSGRLETARGDQIRADEARADETRGERDPEVHVQNHKFVHAGQPES
ncbi:MAG: integration host factor subunit beta [Phycisphaerales bacterium]|jgi:integration host factor subunit beta